MSSYTFDNGELAWLAIAGLFLPAAILCAVPWVRNRGKAYPYTRTGMAWGAAALLAVGIMIAGLTVVGANNHFKTDQAEYELSQQGFTVMYLDLSEGRAKVYGNGGCLVRVDVEMVPGIAGKWHTRVFALGALVRGPSQIPCLSGAKTP